MAVLVKFLTAFPAGGMKEIALHTNRQYLRGLVGCISHLTLSTDYHISLVEDAANGKNINTCGTKWQERNPGAEDPSCACVCGWARAGWRSPLRPDRVCHLGRWRSQRETQKQQKKNTLFPLIPSPFLSFPDQMKPSILCMNRALYPLSV